MDARLEGLVPDIVTPAVIDRLCVNAVLCARDDLGRSESDELLGNFLTVHLASVLSMGLTPYHAEAIARFDPQAAQAELDRYAIPVVKFRRGRRVGDRCLFLSSQECWGQHPRTERFQRQVIGSGSQQLTTIVGLGQFAYMVASAHANDWSDFQHRLFAIMADRFLDHGQLLGLAGVLIGFTPVVDEVIHQIDPVVTLDDVLEALSAFRDAPSRERWDRLADLIERHHVHHPEFRLELPPRPET